MTVDGSDFKIYQPKPWCKKWFSHKFNGPGLRYKVAVCIYSSRIAWIKGPFPCGSFPDPEIYSYYLFYELKEGEKVIADKGYRHCPTCTTPCQPLTQAQRTLMRRVGQRQEHVNKRMKQFGILRKQFRNRLDQHKMCFNAVAVITQFAISDDEPLMDSFN
jgi:hypothetical protein